MNPTRLVPALALILLFPARADESASAKTPAPADAKKTAAAPAPAAKPAPAGAPSMVVTRDPATGTIRPATAEEIRALNALRPQAAPAAPEVVILPDGTKMVTLGEEFMSYAVVRRNPDGTHHRDLRPGRRGRDRRPETAIRFARAAQRRALRASP